MRIFLVIALLAISCALTAQIERPKWEVGGGVRLNYMSLNGGFSGYRASDGYNFDIKYDEIGMHTYSPSFAIAAGGRIKKWNLEFGGSRGVYEGGFKAPADIVREGQQIDSGALISGKVDMTMYLLSTSFGIIQRKHDLGVGIGFLALKMGSDYTTTDTFGEEIKIGDSYWFPMPFLALTGRLNFDRWKFLGSVGGAIFSGKVEGKQMDVAYYYLDAVVVYEFLQTERMAFSADVGYRNLFLDLKIDEDQGWYKEKDIYSGAYATLRVKFYSEEMWKFVRRKDRK